MYVRKEALLSSQIEGKQCTLEDILSPFVNQNTNLDVVDVVNHVKAIEYAAKHLKTLPLCNRLIKETHAILLGNSRGQEKIRENFVIRKIGLVERVVHLKMLVIYHQIQMAC